MIIVRTHYFDDDVDALCKQLIAVSEDDICLAVDERNGPIDTASYKKISLDIPAIEEMSLPVPQNVFWRCGDYCLYFARYFYQEHDTFWVIEPDVVLNFDDGGRSFFKTLRGEGADFVVPRFAPAEPSWYWHQFMANKYESVYSCLFSIARFSGRAVDHLYEGRKNSKHDDVRSIPNDESFCATELANAGYFCKDLNEIIPDVYTSTSFSFVKPKGRRWLKEHGDRNIIYHPVLRGERLRTKIAVALEGRKMTLGEVRSVMNFENDMDGYRNLIKDKFPLVKNSISGTVCTFVHRNSSISLFVNNNKDIIQREHAAGRFYEAEELGIIERNFRPGTTFVDIGANVGNHTVYVSKFLKPDRVICFEPNIDARTILVFNCRLNELENVSLEDSIFGLSDASQYATAQVYEDNLGGTRLSPNPDGSIPLVAGDSILASSECSFLKIDVEGLELNVLMGLERTIAEHKPRIFIEVGDNVAQAFHKWVDGHGYAIVEEFRRYKYNSNFMLVHSSDE